MADATFAGTIKPGTVDLTSGVEINVGSDAE